MNPNAENRRFATEDRLRAALAARAALVTHRDLCRDAPPQGRRWGVRQVRRAAFTALGVVAAVMAVCLPVLLPDRPLDPAPVPPARTPGISEPPPSTPAHPVAPSATDPQVVRQP